MNHKWLNIVVFKKICVILASPGLTPQEVNRTEDSWTETVQAKMSVLT